ncbi:hypothetical protein PBI_SCTP2_11 [Salicola phage SCTP-2]|nr:hypothetical protein PBI_SCTP2_11 [Salicola phage SCTP-2]
MSKSLSELISNILNVNNEEVKDVIPDMSLTDLVEITDAIRNNDEKKVFEIYNGYLI